MQQWLKILSGHSRHGRLSTAGESMALSPSPRTPQQQAGRLVGRAIRSRRGIAALEFSVVGGVLVVILLGGFDVANALQEGIRLRQAVAAGSTYAVQYPSDTAGIKNAMTAALPSSWSTSQTIAYSCAGSSSTTTSSSPLTCSSGALMTLSVSLPYSPMLIKTLTQVTASNVIQYK